MKKDIVWQKNEEQPQGMDINVRNSYMLALNELMGTLSVSEYKQIDTNEFCHRHNLPADFFEVLRYLDGLVLDFAREEGYKRTPELAKITPEQVFLKIYDLSKQDAEKRFDEVVATAKGKPSKDVVEKPANKPVVTDFVQSEPVPYPMTYEASASCILNNPPATMPLATPYRIEIQAKGLQLDMQVSTTEDADLIDALLFKLNRVADSN